MTEIFCILAHGPDKEKLKLALAKGLEKAQEYNLPIMMLVPALGKAPNTILGDLIGESFVKKLTKRKACTLNGVPVRIESMKTYSAYSHKAVVVALWGGDKMLEKIDETLKKKQSKAIVAISWLPEELEPWAKSNNAVIINV